MLHNPHYAITMMIVVKLIGKRDNERVICGFLEKFNAWSVSHRAISHLLTSTPLLGMKPIPLWGSLLLKVLR